MNAAGQRPRATLPARLRLKTQRQFQRVYQRGARATGAWLTVVAWFGRPAADAPAAAGPRLGLSVSKDHGGAVRRNKLKR
ncbi:MAG: ribonuclease P protein component, partial [Planctomycetes bacterium]|nr:ribonuclease P protein component [Planctomycetota bacterium]